MSATEASLPSKGLSPRAMHLTDALIRLQVDAQVGPAPPSSSFDKTLLMHSIHLHSLLTTNTPLGLLLVPT